MTQLPDPLQTWQPHFWLNYGRDKPFRESPTHGPTTPQLSDRCPPQMLSSQVRVSPTPLMPKGKQALHLRVGRRHLRHGGQLLSVPPPTFGGRQGGRNVWLCQWRSNLAKWSGSALSVGGSLQNLRSCFGQGGKTVPLGLLEGSAFALENPRSSFFYFWCPFSRLSA